LLLLVFPFAGGVEEEGTTRGAKAENVCGVALSFPLSFILDFDDDDGVKEFSSFSFSLVLFALETSVSATSCFVFSFEVAAAGAGFVDLEDFREVERWGCPAVAVVNCTDPLDVEAVVADGGDEVTDRLTSLVVESPSARPCWTLFRLEDAAVTADPWPLVAETGGRGEVGVGTDRLVASPSARPCWTFFRLDDADPLVAGTGEGDEDGDRLKSLITSPSARLFFRIEVVVVVLLADSV
jgi:hypothetical protein